MAEELFAPKQSPMYALNTREMRWLLKMQHDNCNNNIISDAKAYIRQLLNQLKIIHNQPFAAYIHGSCRYTVIQINDIDIMTVGEGIPFAERLSNKLGRKKVVPFEKFGTAHLYQEEKSK